MPVPNARSYKQSTRPAPAAADAALCTPRRLRSFARAVLAAGVVLAAVRQLQVLADSYRVTDPSSLPCGPQPTQWPAGGWEAAEAWSVAIDPASGMLTSSATMRPLPGVTDAMLHWLFLNLHRTGRDPRDGKTYPLYRLMHPRDHVSLSWRSPDSTPADTPVPGSLWDSAEVYGLGCSLNGGNASSEAEPLLCPHTGRAASCSSAAAELAAAPSWRGTLLCTQLARGVVQLEFAPLPGVTVARITLRYSYDPASHALRTTVVASTGLDSASAVARGLNTRLVLPSFAATTQGGARAAALHSLLHVIQEFAWLPLWLPHVYEAAAGGDS